MKIGFIGNVVNTMYLTAGYFRALGYEAHYYHIPAEFMFSQPFWEDLDLYVPYEQLTDFRLIQKLRRSWTKPDWVLEKVASPTSNRLGRYLSTLPWLTWRHLSSTRVWRELALNVYPFYKHELRTCDWVMTGGLTGLLACAQAGVPYVYWPHGQDLRDAAGQRESLQYAPNIDIVRRAVRSATACGSHGSQMNLLLKEICEAQRVTAIPYMIDTEAFRPEKIDPELPFLPEEIKEMLKDRGRIFFYMPSRFSDRWKGTGMFLAAYLEAVKKFPGRFFLITSGWGQDYPKYREMIAADETGRQSIYCLTGALSKGYLRRMLNAADVVVDQFNLGWYGSSLIEGAAAGRMVLINMDREMWQQHVEALTFPPVRECRTHEQLVKVLGDLAQGKIDYHEDGRRMLDWARHNHDMHRWVPHLARLVQEALTP